MAENKATPYSDEWWLTALMNKKLAKPTKGSEKTSDSRRYDYTRDEWLAYKWSYHTGEAPLADLAEKWGEATKEFLRYAKTNYAALVVEALMNRVQFLGVRKANVLDPDGDNDVRAALAANGSFFSDAVEYAAAMGEGYVLIGPPAEEGGYAIATAEDPRNLVVITDPANPNIVLAGMKVYRNELEEIDVAALYLRADKEHGIPKDVCKVFVRQAKSAWTGKGFDPKEWKLDEERSTDLAIDGMGVPIVPLFNKHGVGEFEQHLDLLDRITNGISDRLWAAKYQIFRQRALKGNVPQTDDSGRPIDYNEIFAADPGAMWVMPADSEIWESQQLDVNAILAPVKADIQELSAVTQTPLPVLQSDSVNGSAEGATLAREGISFKADDRIQRWSPAAVRIARLLLAYSQKPSDGEFEAIWAPVERLSLQQRMAAGRDAKQADVPVKAIWGDVMQMPPTTVARWGLEYDEQDMMSKNATPPQLQPFTGQDNPPKDGEEQLPAVPGEAKNATPPAPPADNLPVG